MQRGIIEKSMHYIRGKMRVWIINLILVIMLTACSSVPVNPVVENTPTSTPTITNTPTVAPSPTTTATLEPTKDPYTVDAEKIHNFPKSAAEVIANPDKFQLAPDGIDNPQALKDWYYIKFVPVMGDQTKLEPTLKITSIVSPTNLTRVQIALEHRQELMRDPEFFYFWHGKDLYVVPVLTFVDDRGYNGRTWALILSKADSLERLDNGFITQINIYTVVNGYITPVENKVIAGGINGAISDNNFQIALAEIFN